MALCHNSFKYKHKRTDSDIVRVQIPWYLWDNFVINWLICLDLNSPQNTIIIDYININKFHKVLHEDIFILNVIKSTSCILIRGKIKNESVTEHCTCLLRKQKFKCCGTNSGRMEWITFSDLQYLIFPFSNIKQNSLHLRRCHDV